MFYIVGFLSGFTCRCILLLPTFRQFQPAFYFPVFHTDCFFLLLQEGHSRFVLYHLVDGTDTDCFHLLICNQSTCAGYMVLIYIILTFPLCCAATLLFPAPWLDMAAYLPHSPQVITPKQNSFVPSRSVAALPLSMRICSCASVLCQTAPVDQLRIIFCSKVVVIFKNFPNRNMCPCHPIMGVAYSLRF